MKFIQKIAEALKYTFADKKTVDEMAKHTTRTVLFYADADFPFTIDFEEKTFNSTTVANAEWVILDIPYNARFSYEQIEENRVRLTLNNSGHSLEEFFNDLNLIVDIRRFIGEPQE